MAAKDHTASEPYVHPDDPAGWLKPGEPLMVDGLDWSWAFVVYKEISNFTDLWIGTNGMIWSCRVLNGISQRGAWHRIYGTPITGGYIYVTLKEKGKRYCRAVHRLVLSTHYGPCPEGKEGCHFPDGDKRNNRLRNLRWDTSLNNHADQKRHGTNLQGSQVGNAKLREEDIPVIRRMAKEGIRYKLIGNHFGVHEATISWVIIGRTWKHVV